MYKKKRIDLNGEVIDKIFSRKSEKISLGENEELILNLNMDDDIRDVVNRKNMLLALKRFYSAHPHKEDNEKCNRMLELFRDFEFDNEFGPGSSIIINGNFDASLDFIRTHWDFFEDKEVCLLSQLEVNNETYCKIKDKLQDFPNVKLKVNGNERFVSFKEYENTVLAIQEIVDKVKVYNYSPLEQAIYVYDLVRDRCYVDEGIDDLPTDSRDLTSVLSGEKIVCLGFANIYNTVLKVLGFNTSVFKLYFKFGDSGHARVFANINDEKYDINGLYFFDPTFDCKKDDSNNFLGIYKFFARTKEQIEEFDGHLFNYGFFEFFTKRDVDKWASTIIGEKVTSFDLAKRPFSTAEFQKICYLMNTDFNPLKATKQEVVEFLYSFLEKVNTPLDLNKFLEALYIVRRNQYYERPDKFVLDSYEFSDILDRSEMVDFAVKENPYAKLLDFEFAKSLEIDDLVEKLEEKYDIERDIERIKLIRTLREATLHPIDGEGVRRKK